MTPEEENKDPFLFEFLELKDEYSVYDLESALIVKPESFLLELGGDFTCVGRQRLRVGDACYRLDLSTRSLSGPSLASSSKTNACRSTKNASERSLRMIALGRKNYLFVGDVDAGKSRAAVSEFSERRMKWGTGCPGQTSAW